jgi:hypothetical protein
VNPLCCIILPRSPDSSSSNSRIEIDLKQLLTLAEELNEKNEDIRGFLQSRALGSEPVDAVDLPTAMTGSPTVPLVGSEPTHQDEDISLQESLIDIGNTRAFHHNGKILMDSKQLTMVSAIGIRSAHFPRTACKPWCSCICHTETRLQTPQFLRRFLGNLFVGYSGLPVLTKPCNQNSCHLRAQPMSYITYFFPLWFLDRMVSLTMTTIPLAGPVISLKTQRTVPGTADIFTYAKSGNVDKMQMLFKEGLASPHDVHYESGVTALHVSYYDCVSYSILLNEYQIAISHRHLEVCKYLLDMNADPFLEDRARW